MSTLRCALGVAALMLLGCPRTAAADAATSPAAGTQPAAAKPAAAATVNAVRRDPAGVKGISPFWEAINKGDQAYIARDYDAALAAYAEANKARPEKGVGHLRSAQAHLAKGQLAEAEAAYDKALAAAGNDASAKAKVLFLIADLRERQRASEAALEAWNAYAQHLQQSGAKGYPNTAADRKKRAEAYRENVAQSAEVKKRIAVRQKEADEKLKKSAE